MGCQIPRAILANQSPLCKHRLRRANALPMRDRDVVNLRILEIEATASSCRFRSARAPTFAIQIWLK